MGSKLEAAPKIVPKQRVSTASYESERSGSSSRYESESTSKHSHESIHVAPSMESPGPEVGAAQPPNQPSQREDGEVAKVSWRMGSPLYDREDHRVVSRQGSHVGSGVSRRLNDHILHNEEAKNESFQESPYLKKKVQKAEGGLFLARNLYSYETKTDEDQDGVVRPISPSHSRGYARYLEDSDDETGSVCIHTC